MAPALVKSLNRLPSSSLIDLALKWLQKNSQCTPYLQSNRSLNESEEEDYLFPPAEDVDTLRKIYEDFRSASTEKSHIIDRILDGDWRRGLSLQQLAMIDFAYLEQNDTALRWSALRLTPLENEESLPKGFEEPSTKRRKLNTSTPSYPTIQPSSFVASLKSHISPLVKAHYHLQRLPAPYNLSILRIYLTSRTAFAPTASNIPRSARHATDTGRVIYIALPDSCPYVYISLSGSTSVSKDKTSKATPANIDAASLKRMILEAIPKALSRPQQRWSLEPTKLITKSLKSICELRGNGKPGTAGGAYSQFADDERQKRETPLEVQHLPPPSSERAAETEALDENDDSESEDVELKHKSATRFGTMSGQHRASLDRFHVKIADVMRPPDSARSTTEAAPVTLSFAGNDVFLGLKTLAELGEEYVDLKKLPSWLTGEMGVSILSV